MAKLGREQIMVAGQMVQKGASLRQVARQMGVSEGALRYRLKQRSEEPRPDGRSRQPAATDGYEEAVRAILEGTDDARLTGRGRPMQARRVYALLVRDYGYGGSYQAVVRHLRRRYGRPKLRALRRVETPPGVQAQHDWFEVAARVAGERVQLPVLVGTLSHSRARFVWVSRTADQLAWHSGHLALFRRYGGVPLWVRIDNLKTGVAKGAGPTAVLNRSYELFARACGFEADPCRARTGSDKGKVERSVRTFRSRFGDLFDQEWRELEALQAALDERAERLLDDLTCPVTGTSVREALGAERLVLQPVPTMEEPFDVVVSRPVYRDCLVSFEGRRYSVPFAWADRQVEVYGLHAHVSIRAEGSEIARWPRRTRERLLLDPAHFEGEDTDRVLRPTPLGVRARLQLAGLSGAAGAGRLATSPQGGGASGAASGAAPWPALPDPDTLTRPIDAYAALVEVLR